MNGGNMENTNETTYSGPCRALIGGLASRATDDARRVARQKSAFKRLPNPKRRVPGWLGMSKKRYCFDLFVIVYYHPSSRGASQNKIDDDGE